VLSSPKCHFGLVSQLVAGYVVYIFRFFGHTSLVLCKAPYCASTTEHRDGDEVGRTCSMHGKCENCLYNVIRKASREETT
jgi:hypothetical protein